MACTTAAGTVASSSSWELSTASSSSFVNAIGVRLAAPAQRKRLEAGTVSAKCSLQNDGVTGVGRREALGKAVAGGLMGAALLGMMPGVGADVALALGPGNSGAERTAQKADQLLKAADKLNIKDAPKRYGPGTPGAAQDPDTISQKAGSGAAPSLQEGAASVQQGAKDLASKSSQIQDAAKDTVGQAQSKASESGVLGSLQEGLQGLKESVAQKGKNAQSAAQDTARNIQQTVQ